MFGCISPCANNNGKEETGLLLNTGDECTGSGGDAESKSHQNVKLHDIFFTDECNNLCGELLSLALDLKAKLHKRFHLSIIHDCLRQISAVVAQLETKLGRQVCSANHQLGKSNISRVPKLNQNAVSESSRVTLPTKETGTFVWESWRNLSPLEITQKSKKMNNTHRNSKFDYQFHLLDTMNQELRTQENVSLFWGKLNKELKDIKAGVSITEQEPEQQDVLAYILSDIQSLSQEKTVHFDSIDIAPFLSTGVDHDEDFSNSQQQTSLRHLATVAVLSWRIRQKVRVLANNARKRYRQKVRWIIHPNSMGKVVFNLCVTLLILFSILLTPFQLAFENEESNGIQVAGIICDAVFLFDILVHFSTAFEKENSLVYNRKEIAERYLRGSFIADFMGAFPFDLLLIASHALKIVRLARLVRLVRLGKMFKVGLLLFRVKKKLKSMDFSYYVEPPLISLIFRVFGIVYLSHLVACTWYVINDCPNETSDWLRCGNAGSFMSRYLAALYFIYTTMMTVGYGDVTINTASQRAFCIIVQILGTLSMGVLVSSIGEVVSSSDLQSKYLAERMSSLKMYTTEKKLPSNLRHKLHQHFMYFYSQTTVFPEQGVVQTLPCAVFKKMTLEKNTKYIEKIYFFRHFDTSGHRKFVLTLLPLLKPMQANEADKIVCQGDPAEELYFLVSGQVNSFREIRELGEVFFGAYTDGSTLNLEENICRRGMLCSMLAVCVCQLLWVDTEDLGTVLNLFPCAYSLVKDMARTKLQNILKVLNSSTSTLGKHGIKCKDLVFCEPSQDNDSGLLPLCDAPIGIDPIKGTLIGRHKSVRIVQCLVKNEKSTRQLVTTSVNNLIFDSEQFEKDESAEYLKKNLLIGPENKYKVVWDAIILVITLYSVIMIPFRIGFDYNTKGFVYTDMIIDGFYCTDIVLTFRTLYLVAPGLYIADTRKIAILYLKTWFFVDIISSLPLASILSFLSNSSSAASASRLIRVIRFVRFLRLLRLFRLARLSKRYQLNKWEAQLEAQTYYINQIFQLFVVLLYFGHFLGCFWAFIAFEEGTCNSWMSEIPEGINILPNVGIKDQYVASVYWAFTTLSTVGYGDIKPQTDKERGYTTVVMLIGAATFAYIVGNVSNLLHQLTILKSLKKTKVADVSAFAKEQKFGPALSLSIKKHLFFSFCSHTSSLEAGILERLPSIIRRETLLHSALSLTQTIPIFRIPALGGSMSTIHIAIIFQRMHAEFCEAGSFIYAPKDGSKGLYFLTKGVAEEVEESRSYLSPDEYVVFCTVEKGGFFGHRKYLNLVHQSSGARAQKDCHLYVLYTHELNNLDEKFPLVAQKLRNSLRKYFWQQHFLSVVGQNSSKIKVPSPRDLKGITDNKNRF